MFFCFFSLILRLYITSLFLLNQILIYFSLIISYICRFIITLEIDYIYDKFLIASIKIEEKNLIKFHWINNKASKNLNKRYTKRYKDIWDLFQIYFLKNIYFKLVYYHYNTILLDNFWNIKAAY